MTPTCVSPHCIGDRELQEIRCKLRGFCQLNSASLFNSGLVLTLGFGCTSLLHATCSNTGLRLHSTTMVPGLSLSFRAATVNKSGQRTLVSSTERLAFSSPGLRGSQKKTRADFTAAWWVLRTGALRLAIKITEVEGKTSLHVRASSFSFAGISGALEAASPAVSGCGHATHGHGSCSAQPATSSGLGALSRSSAAALRRDGLLKGCYRPPSLRL